MNKTRIVCYGDSNTWGYDASTGLRFPDDVRWTQLLAERLGLSYQICEEGLSGRTSVFEDPLFEGLNGLASLTPILGSHNPIDLLVVMLGTNDCKQRFAATAQNIADGVRRLVQKAQILPVWRNQPQVLIVAPILIGEAISTVPRISEGMGAVCAEKSWQLPRLLEATAAECSCHYLDANAVVTANTVDYMHFDLASNQRFCDLLADWIAQSGNDWT
ncbi:MAG: lipolytic enzyme, G-D-S-L [Clostridia bacterium]|nr:lipolytic enzyme, G-D-S-L [Clostridia bacterium]